MFWVAAALAAPLQFAEGEGSLGFHAVASLHEFDGKAQRFSGSFDPETGEGEIVVPVRALSTGIGARDSRMIHSSLAVADHPEIRLDIHAVEGAEAFFAAQAGVGTGIVTGSLEIRGVRVAVRIPVELRWEGPKLGVRGSFPLRLADFGIPDPSILTSTMRPEVTVRLDLLGSPP